MRRAGLECRRRYFYPRSPCGERPLRCQITQTTYRFLSTLSLRRATRTGLTCGDGQNISIHALLAESDAETAHERANSLPFLSTLSLRRATLLTAGGTTILDISIHALNTKIDDLISYFYPRSPCGERPYLQDAKQENQSISIHALLAESDPRGQLPTPKPPNFYPRSPCGERHSSIRIN